MTQKQGNYNYTVLIIITISWSHSECQMYTTEACTHISSQFTDYFLVCAAQSFFLRYEYSAGTLQFVIIYTRKKNKLISAHIFTVEVKCLLLILFYSCLSVLNFIQLHSKS